jgi:hypothetical protein
VTETLTAAAVEARRQRDVDPAKVVFRVAGLYGICPAGLEAPIGEDRTIVTGPITVTVDPDADATCNIGVIDFDTNTLRVRYGAQAVFPALYELARTGEHDVSMLAPVRMVATDDCTLTPNLMGWRALGCLDFLPGSVWSGATGG